MTESTRSFDWHGTLLDVVVIVSMTVLTALNIATLTVFLAVVGPIVGARLAAARMLRGGHGGGPVGGALAVLLGLLFLLRRPSA
jgi:hypothetical protein